VGRLETTLTTPGFAAYAELCGAQGIRVTSRGELEPALASALAHPGPSLVEVVQDPELSLGTGLTPGPGGSSQG
jgi:thiamine pyrophosphate-dependent acetolactate synthase large subunit-like protein